jgi:hypothetical protein
MAMHSGANGHLQTKAKANYQATLDRFESRQRTPVVHPSPPTVTYSGTIPDATYFREAPWRNVARPIGAFAYSQSFTGPSATAAGAFVGIEFSFTGRYLAVGWVCQTATKERVRIYVDGMPIAAAPETPSVTTSPGNGYYCFIDFGSEGTRKVEFLVTSAAAIHAIFTKVTEGITWATPPRRRLWIVGDSFIGGSAALSDNTFAPDAQIAQALDIDVGQSGLSGTGYTSAGSFTVFGSATRVAQAALFDPHDIVIMGSVNDAANPSALSTAALACWAAYKAACPNARLIVMGVQPSNATDTISANRFANNAALYTAALGNPNVDRFVDMIGNAGTAPVGAWTSGVTYQPADKVTRLGSVWQLDRTAAYSDTTFYPGIWRLLTGLVGTGRVGATASDGNRDTFLYSDTVHPTEKGCAALARRIIEAVYT